jgi:hypothetical protein
MGDGFRLGVPDRIERDVGVALGAPLGVPVGLAVPQQDQCARAGERRAEGALLTQWSPR